MDGWQRSINCPRKTGGGAYNGAVAESRAANGLTDIDPLRLFSRDEIEVFVGDFRSDKLSIKAPAMKHYLELLEQGYKWPALM
jgi:hypothetical protein